MKLRERNSRKLQLKYEVLFYTKLQLRTLQDHLKENQLGLTVTILEVLLHQMQKMKTKISKKILLHLRNLFHRQLVQLKEVTKVTSKATVGEEADDKQRTKIRIAVTMIETRCMMRQLKDTLLQLQRIVWDHFHQRNRRM